MRFICLGYHEEGKWEAMTDAERETYMSECFSYDRLLEANGHMVGGQALQYSRNAVTIRYRDGRVTPTDGPFAETKEQLGGLMVLEADDLTHAVELMSKHPSIPYGSIFEVRPTEEIPGAPGKPLV